MPPGGHPGGVRLSASTWRVAASSSAIWNPERPPPTTTGPHRQGLRVAVIDAVDLGD
jgi:hypothetical protein